MAATHQPAAAMAAQHRPCRPQFTRAARLLATPCRTPFELRRGLREGSKQLLQRRQAQMAALPRHLSVQASAWNEHKLWKVSRRNESSSSSDSSLDEENKGWGPSLSLPRAIFPWDKRYAVRPHWRRLLASRLFCLLPHSPPSRQAASLGDRDPACLWAEMQVPGLERCGNGPGCCDRLLDSLGGGFPAHSGAV